MLFKLQYYLHADKSADETPIQLAWADAAASCCRDACAMSVSGIGATCWGGTFTIDTGFFLANPQMNLSYCCSIQGLASEAYS